ncbi:DUF4398 domain-containing protein [Undibacterium sp. Ren11W]|uniref:DUF4398 domain-containing protein n=1 Tax=Undibacterium sp. Ren11W TaxID=3413045 RepID=UPI003BF32A72
MMKKNREIGLLALCSLVVVLTVACTSMKVPANADVAVSKAAVDNAATAGGAEFAPMEMTSAREKMASANIALTKKDYKLAIDLANQAQADAKLAQSKATSAKAQAAADALQEDIGVLREELNRANQK